MKKINLWGLCIIDVFVRKKENNDVIEYESARKWIKKIKYNSEKKCTRRQTDSKKDRNKYVHKNAHNIHYSNL